MNCPRGLEFLVWPECRFLKGGRKGISDLECSGCTTATDLQAQRARNRAGTAAATSSGHAQSALSI
jgi:hypothetical protein